MTIFSRHPVDNPSISQRFGVMNGREFQGHVGVDYRPDFPGQVGKVIYAPADMFIVWARGSGFAAGNPWDQLPNNGNAGNCVIGAHPAPHQAVCTLYAHMDQIWVAEGQFVRAGEPLGTMGWTGYILPKNQNGSHLHWEMFIDYADGVYPPGTFYGRVNPLDYFITETVVPVGTGGKGSASTTPNPEEDFMGGTIDASQAEDIAKRAAQLVLDGLLPALDNKVRINAVQAESVVQATVKRVGEQATGKTINLQQADDIARASARYAADEQAARLTPKKEGE